MNLETHIYNTQFVMKLQKTFPKLDFFKDLITSQIYSTSNFQ